MDLPHVFKREPTLVRVEKGKTYSWCTCGLSEKNPFCDGHHKTIDGLPFRSLKFTAEEDGDVLLCNCKHTKNPPYCDGSHKQLSSL
jgi:CDGSH-type Zn-finger protein